nr:S1 RNA-binding domain-containing protein [uncultured Carboxylicivirga sp.]
MKSKNTPKDNTLIFSEGDRISGIVTDIRDYGCLVEVENGIKGLIMVSEMSWLNHNIHPSQLLSIGENIEVFVLDYDNTRKKLSLSLKRCQPNPWEQFASKYKDNDTLTGTIESITTIGIFVKLDDGVKGHIFPMDISENLEIEKLSKGDQLEVTIISIDSERERIFLKTR